LGPRRRGPRCGSRVLVAGVCAVRAFAVGAGAGAGAAVRGAQCRYANCAAYPAF
jgi:hypothetical protein